MSKEKNLTILICDDNESILEILTEYLQMLNHIVISFNDGQELLDYVINFEINYDLIISDINMPILDGFQLYQNIKKINPDIPIILISGNPKNKSISIQKGYPYFLNKPFYSLNIFKKLISEIF